MLVVTLRWVGPVVMLLIARGQLVADWPLLKPRLPYLFVMGATGFTIFNALFYAAAHNTKAVNIGILQGSIPVFVLIGMFLVYRNTVTAIQLLGVSLRLPA